MADVACDAAAGRLNEAIGLRRSGGLVKGTSALFYIVSITRRACERTVAKQSRVIRDYVSVVRHSREPTASEAVFRSPVRDSRVC
jgi:hypothetical protein